MKKGKKKNPNEFDGSFYNETVCSFLYCLNVWKQKNCLLFMNYNKKWNLFLTWLKGKINFVCSEEKKKKEKKEKRKNSVV